MTLSTKEAGMHPGQGGHVVAPGRRRRKWVRYSPWTFYLFVSPWVIGFLALTVVPLLFALLMSFTNFDGLTDTWHWVGLHNYQRALQDDLFWTSIVRTLLFTGVAVPLSIAGGLGLALLLNQRIRGVGIFRTLFYLPSVVPVVATALMFRMAFDRDLGFVNLIIEFFHGHDIFWLSDPMAFWVLIMVMLWGLGGGMVIFLAGLQGIPTELHEAAALDGANAFHKFRAITLPLLSPVLFFQMVVSMIFTLQTFIQPFLLVEGQGSASGLTDTSNVPRGNYLYMVHVAAQYFSFQRYGYGSALLWILFALILLVTLLIFRTSAFWVYYEVDRDKSA
ncbi:MAG TPA: sugar ABC transporter permease [Ktedonosporobacter sp.]|nr:sugar ABC transporter permease [Ktedonosporobacter sp.]